MRRITGLLGIAAPLAATIVVLVVGRLTAGYDPMNLTISRLAEPGLPNATAVRLAILAVGVALLGLALALGPGARTGRVLLAIAGIGLLAAAAIPLDPASPRATTTHRVATSLAMLALTCGPLALAPGLHGRKGWSGYGALSFWLGVLEVGMLLLGFALLPTTFAVGAWERCLLALPMAWMVLLSARLLRTSSTEPSRSSTAESSTWAAVVSAAETISADAASASSGRL